MIIERLKKEGLKGRGGAAFPTGLKWEAVKNAKADKKYVICNASEGEPGVLKDLFILRKYPEEVIKGINLAMREIGSDSAYIFLNPKYFPKLEKKLKKAIKDLPIVLFKKPHGYICGEESTLLNVIEGKPKMPRLKPPFPTEKGLWDYPTLINNVETFYQAVQVAEGKYKAERFYTLGGKVKKKGIAVLPENFTVRQILEHTGNWPNFDFFVQVGGGMSGEILVSEELDRPAGGAGSIIIYKKNANPMKIMRKWARFFMNESCGQCVPCREGTFRLNEALKRKDFDRELVEDILFVLSEASLCPLGKGAAVPFIGYLNKIYAKKP
ncbi:MAG: NADH-ubiquinone oxidoreductase-F iron-sulfur binding region domain-containing protein [Candidatus Paceibacterota bacterium]|jgi:NADH:ubiquinone oxidoreductase subunit F (NADH-binding)|nr:NADH-ubiquinone oxidoreductase-F iron-sulfur binding region domain-containing protein [Candidatus Paceibacterota bacterium]MDD4830723.1 NADH-ubiquinone oxidoreductase-F iron-sulfur binding region domain-containing protein [Candidatus Paceibacterota bacterium]MDD4875128.1 NADH-ubiquinone oxidoreductase-F iron-sulfur binding region domain-containing protein [Candidatus Paceibacterota bacterium]